MRKQRIKKEDSCAHVIEGLCTKFPCLCDMYPDDEPEDQHEEVPRCATCGDEIEYDENGNELLCRCISQ